MQLSGIGDYLEIYRKRLFSAEDQKKVLIHTIAEVSGVVIDEKDMTIDRATITIKTDTVTRHHLFLYKTQILEAIKKNSSKVIADIR
jgi:Ni,Fe-hydrogenase III component G